MNITFIPNRSITLVTSNFKVMTATKDNPNWALIEEAVKNNDEQALINAISIKNTIKAFSGNVNDIEIRGNDIFYRGEKLFGEDVTRIMSYLTSGAPKASMVKFLNAKLLNTVPSSVASLYNFLTNKEMPITDNGTILGFKGVRNDYYSVNTGREPLISGTRRDDGAILNSVGETVWMERHYVDADPNQGCGPGLHIGSRNYAKNWGSRVMVVEFSPAHVVVVPNGNCEVLRAFKYNVVGELNETDYLGETYNGDYARPIETPEPVEEVSEPIELEVFEVVTPTVADTIINTMASKNFYNISDWSKGQANGFKDGKAHSKRKFYECDKNRIFKKSSKEFVAGYNVGYKDGRNS